MGIKTYIPVTPGGSVLAHLESKTKRLAKRRVLMEASHMYSTWHEMAIRGYTIAVKEEAGVEMWKCKECEAELKGNEMIEISGEQSLGIDVDIFACPKCGSEEIEEIVNNEQGGGTK